MNALVFVPWVLALASAAYLFRGWVLNRREHREAKAAARRLMIELNRHQEEA